MRDSWRKVKLGAVCTTFAGGTPSRTNPSFYNGDIPWISSGEVNQATITKTAEHITESALKLSSAKWIPANAVLMAMYGATAGQVSKLKIRATSNQAVLALIPRKDDNDFIYHQLKLRKEKILFFAQGSGQPNLSKNLIDSTLIPLPPLPHQRKIAKILNTVDAVIEKTEAAIAKYKAVKQGMMQDIFTRGIDPQTGKLRPSQKDAPQLYKETELGWIPKEWEVERFGDLVIGKGVYGINAAAVNYDPGKYAYLRITDISENGFFISDGRKSVEHPEARNFLLSEGDIVFARTGNSTGKTYLYDEKDGKLVFAGFLIKFHPNPKDLLPGFIKFYTETYWYWNWVEIYSARTGQPGINGNEYGKLPIPTPMVAEQKMIVKKLNSINRKIESENKTLSKHQSLKKGLMQDLLTGKVEVEV